MKKSAKLKRKTRRLLIKNLIVFAVLVAVSFVGVRSWFLSAHDSAASKAGGLNITCTIPEGLEVAILQPGYVPDSDTVWHNTSFTISGSNYGFLASLSLADITSNGKTFIKPPIYQISAVATVQTQQ